MTRTFGATLLSLLVCGAYASAQFKVAPRGTAAAISTVDELRKENAQLRAMLIGRDQIVANCQFELQKQTAELRADLDGARLSARAAELLVTLRQLHDVNDDTPFDWRTGTFRFEKRAVVPYEVGQEPQEVVR